MILAKLTEEEQAVAKKIAKKIIEDHKGKPKKATSNEIIRWVESEGHSLSAERFRKMVMWLRHKGMPVCSSSAGYWLAVDKADLKETIKRLKDRIDSQMKTLNQLIETLKKWQ